MRTGNALLPCFLVLLFAGATACGGGNFDFGVDAARDQDPDAAGSGSGSGSDAGGSGPYPDAGGSGSDADAGGSGSDAGGGSGSGDTWEDPECPIYQVECDGECIPAVIDPDNCGGCGITCDDGEVCSGGECIAEDGEEGGCPATEDATVEVCDRKCVDTNWDSQNCGQCGNPCDEGEGCVFGACTAIVGSDEEIAGCEDGGPPIVFPPGEQENGECGGQIAETTFRFGLCSCSGVDFGHRAFVDGFNSAAGAYAPDGRGGGVGANENITTVSQNDVTGVLWSTGADPLVIAHNSTVGEDLYCGGDVQVSNSASFFTVGNDGYVVGDISSGGDVDFGGTLNVRPDSTFDDTEVSYAELVADPDLEVRQACTECDPADQLPVADLVAARSSENDNDLIGLKPDVLVQPSGDVRIDLPCGNYYLNEIDVGTGLNVTIVAHGRTALYVGGDMSFDHPVIIAPAEGAELDVLVAGNAFFGAQPTQLGSPNYPAMFRMYVGGEQGLTATHRVGVGGFIYAVPGGYNQPSQRVEVYGGLYTQSYATGSQTTTIHFDRRVLTIGKECRDDDDDGGDRCTPLGDSCEETADCCTPLQCIDGTCQESIIID